MNNVKIIRHSLSMTIAANFQSRAISVSSSFSRNCQNKRIEKKEMRGGRGVGGVGTKRDEREENKNENDEAHK